MKIKACLRWILTFGLALFFLASTLVYSLISLWSASNVLQAFPFKAAIIDTLNSVSAFNNPRFNQTVTSILKKAGFTIDYYEGEQVTVDFYRQLPTKGYGLIILRTHGAAGLYGSASFFTSEQYSTTRHVWEQLTDQVTQVEPIPNREGRTYFGVSEKFIKQSMQGRFQNTIIIAMSCNGMDLWLAEALIKKGAKVYIGWDGWVTINRTDQAVLNLLEYLAIKKLTIKQAVTETMEKLGSDPIYNSTLIFYPSQSENYTIPNPR